MLSVRYYTPLDKLIKNLSYDYTKGSKFNFNSWEE